MRDKLIRLKHTGYKASKVNPRHTETLLQQRPEFKDFVDGIGYRKWSTDQMLLNYWVKKEKIPTLNMDWRWNGLFKGIDDAQIPKAYFIHFFLKDLLPQKGENVEDLMRVIN